MIPFAKIAAFANAFAAAHAQLPAGTRAMLRRADRPSTLGAFWHCWAQAEQQTEAVNEGRGRIADVLSQLIKIRMFDAFTPSQDAKDTFGAWLAAGKEVPERRIEALLASRDSASVITDLQAIASFKKTTATQSAPPLALGSLLTGLFALQLSATTARIWADDFFRAIR